MLDFRLRNEVIVDRVRNGDTLGRVARDYGISHERVRQICERVGVYSYGGDQPLSEAEKARIEEAYQRGIPIAHIGVDRSVETIRRHLVNAGFHDVIVYVPWTPKEDAALKRLYGKRKCADIGALMGRTKNEIIGRANRLGLCQPKQ